MLTALKQAWKVLSANKTRTFLTTLGIMVGIATVILVLSAGAGFRELINSEIASSGSNTLFVAIKVPSANKARAGIPDTGNFGGLTITTLKQRDLEDIKKLPNVVNAYGVVTGQAVASYRDSQKSVVYLGASASRFSIDQSSLSAGRFYTDEEDAGGAQVAILGNALAEDLFGFDDPVGKLVRLDTRNFEIIGVYEASSGLGGGFDDYMFIPLNTAQKKMLGINYMIRAVIQLDNVNLSDVSAEQISGVLRHNHNITNPDKDDFLVATQAEVLGIFDTIFGGITLLLIAIAAISLLVGGVGIMNIMYVVVTERTAEIGLKKALGAKKSDILIEFLIESVLVTLLGGIFGILIGAGLSWILAYVASASGLAWQFTVPFYAIAIGFGVSAVIGIGFGVLPAQNAAKMDPIEALGHE